MPVASVAHPEAPAIQLPATAPFPQDLLEIDGLTVLQLQERFRRLSNLLPQAPCGDRLRAAGRALIHLRRFGGDRYSVHRHVRRRRTEAAAFGRERAEEVRRAALQTGAVVRILGEQRDGRVLFRTIGQDPGDLYPAPWYIVAIGGHGPVRAHGADEVEQA